MKKEIQDAYNKLEKLCQERAQMQAEIDEKLKDNWIKIMQARGELGMAIRLSRD